VPDTNQNCKSQVVQSGARGGKADLWLSYPEGYGERSPCLVRRALGNQALACERDGYRGNVDAVIADYVASKACPRSNNAVVVGQPNGLVVFDHRKRIACGVEDKEVDRGNIAIVILATPATVKGRDGRGRRSVECSCCQSDAASSKRLQGCEINACDHSMYAEDPGTLDGRCLITLGLVGAGLRDGRRLQRQERRRASEGDLEETQSFAFRVNRMSCCEHSYLVVSLPAAEGGGLSSLCFQSGKRLNANSLITR
jgi:hypothetical protein